MPRILFGATAALCLSATAAFTGEIRDGKVAVYDVSRATYLMFEPVDWPKGADGVSISIVGPGEFEAMVETGNEPPQVNLAKLGDLKDGVYDYIITGTTGEKVKAEEVLDNGRDKPAEYEMVSFKLGGFVVIQKGRIVEFSQDPEKGSEETKPGEDTPDGDKGGESEKTEPGKDENDSDKG